MTICVTPIILGERTRSMTKPTKQISTHRQKGLLFDGGSHIGSCGCSSDGGIVSGDGGGDAAAAAIGKGSSSVVGGVG